MKRSLWAAVLAMTTGLTAYPAPQARKNVEAASKITDVVVYPDLARVTRTASVELEGTSEVVIKDLPATLIENSIRARTTGGSAKVVGIEMKHAYAEKSKNEAIARLEEQIQKLADERRTLEDALRVMQNTETFLTALRSQYSDKVSKEMLGSKLDMEGIGKLVELTEKNMTENARKRLDIEVKQRDMNKRMGVLQQELNQIYSKRNTESKIVIVTLDLPQKAKVDVQVSYVIHGASWRSLYDARTVGFKKPIELVYYGVVTQNTGEDWNDIELVLSTARPSISGQPPELAARVVDFQENVRTAFASGKLHAGRSDSKNKGILLEKEESAKSEPLRTERNEDAAAPVAFETAQAEEKATAVFFKVKKRETIASNNQPHKTTVAVESYDAKFEHEAVPSLSAHGFLKASMANKDKPLLGGELNIFVDEDFIGTSFLKTVAPTQPFHAWLGVDESVRTTRKEVKREMGTSGGFLSSTRQRQSLSYTIKLANYKKQPVTLTVTEPAPLTRHEDIEARVLNATPGFSRTEEGFIKWTVDLQPNEQKELSYELEILYPKDRAITHGTLMPQQFRQEYDKLQRLNQQQLEQK